MSNRAFRIVQPDERGSFDLFRLSHSKECVDLAPNTLRKFNRQGLNFYRKGKTVFVSRRELEVFIKS